MRIWWVSPRQRGGVCAFWLEGTESDLARIDAALRPAGSSLRPGEIRHGFFTDPSGTRIDETLLACPLEGTRILTGHGGGATARALLDALKAHGGILAADLPTWFGSEDWTACLLACQTEAQAAAVLASCVFEDPQTCASLPEAEWLAAKAAAPDVATLLRERLVLLVGATNAGKSTLFNALAGQTRALVSPEPGTTRDIVEEVLAINGYAVRFCDTAGVNPDADALEQDAVWRMRDRIGQADCVLHLLDASRPLSRVDRELADWLSGVRVIRVWNKTDCPCRIDEAQLRNWPPADAVCRVCAREGALGDLLPVLTGQLGGMPCPIPAPCTPAQHAVLDAALSRAGLH